MAEAKLNKEEFEEYARKFVESIPDLPASKRNTKKEGKWDCSSELLRKDRKGLRTWKFSLPKGTTLKSWNWEVWDGSNYPEPYLEVCIYMEFNEAS